MFPNIQIPIVLIHFFTSERGQPLYKGQNGWSKSVFCSEVPLYLPLSLLAFILAMYTFNVCSAIHTLRLCVRLVTSHLHHSTGQESHAVRYEPPKPRPMVRPAYLNFIPSPAALSFNFAVQSYQPDNPAGRAEGGQFIQGTSRQRTFQPLHRGHNYTISTCIFNPTVTHCVL